MPTKLLRLRSDAARSCAYPELKGRDGYRLRVGDYRVLIQVQRQERLFIVTNIGPRGDVYK